MKKFNIHDVISDLSGTSMTLQNVLDDYGKDEEDLSQADREAIDDNIFCCDCCSWWCEVDEKKEQESGEDFCADCNEVDDE